MNADQHGTKIMKVQRQVMPYFLTKEREPTRPPAELTSNQVIKFG